MHRYLVERSFAPGSDPPIPVPGEPARAALIEAHEACGVSWVRSYVTSDQRRSYCIVDGPSPEAVRWAARASGLPVDRISEVSVLERDMPRDADPLTAPTFLNLPQELP